MCVKVTVEGLDRWVTSWGKLFVRSEMNKQSIARAVRRLMELGAQMENGTRCKEAA